MKIFIQSLNAFEASRVLNDLLEADSGLVQKAYECAVKVAADVDPESICDAVYTCLSMLHFDDLNGRAGTQGGYLSPYEAACELFEETLTHFVGEIVINWERGLPAAAKACCIGIVKGLQMYDEDPDSEFGGWVEDVTGEFINSVVKEWKNGNPSSDDIAEIMMIVGGDRS